MQALAGTVIDDVAHNLYKIKQFCGQQVGTCKGNVECAIMLKGLKKKNRFFPINFNLILQSNISRFTNEICYNEPITLNIYAIIGLFVINTKHHPNISKIVTFVKWLHMKLESAVKKSIQWNLRSKTSRYQTPSIIRPCFIKQKVLYQTKNTSSIRPLLLYMTSFSQILEGRKVL